MTEPVTDADDPAPRGRDRTRRSAALALIAPDPVGTPPDGAVLYPPVPDPGRRKWFFVQLWDEARLAARMYFDPRYRISRTAQFLLPVIFGLFVLNYFLFSTWFALPIISPVLERVGCVLLGIFFYKVMARELGRYREVLEYLTRYGPR